MQLTRYQPWNILNDGGWNLLNNIRNQLDQLAGTDFPLSERTNAMTRNWAPSVDIKEEGDCYIVLADIPGVDPKDIEVSAENDTLTIKGEKKTESKEEREGYKCIERTQGSFYRRFNLPDMANADKIKAKSKNGVLELTVPKAEKAKPHRIAVTS